MLEFLDAGCNSISFLPESISDLTNLKPTFRTSTFTTHTSYEDSTV